MTIRIRSISIDNMNQQSIVGVELIKTVGPIEELVRSLNLTLPRSFTGIEDPDVIVAVEQLLTEYNILPLDGANS